MALVAFIPFMFRKKVPRKFLIVLLSISVGTLLGSVFIHFIPEAISHGYTLGVAINILLGFLAFFAIERFVHWHHSFSQHGNRGQG